MKTYYAVNNETKTHTRLNVSSPIEINGYKVVEADSEGWIEHTGTVCPLPDDVRCEYRMAGAVNSKQKWLARGLRWTQTNSDTDITHYRPILEQAEPTPAQIEPKESICELFRALDAAHKAAAQIPEIMAKIKTEIEQYGHTVVPLNPFVQAEFVETEAEPAEDMTDWRNWREGDKFEFVKNFERNYGDYFCIGNIYEYGRDKYDDTGIKDSSGVIWSESNPLSEDFMPECFRFHSRPKGE
jgi:hypothetical protein